jgi:rare lipoprotein A
MRKRFARLWVPITAYAGLATAVTVLIALVRAPKAEQPADASPAAQVRASDETGVACYYARSFHGAKTASGERLDVDALTAAHRRLSFATRVHVKNLDNGRSVIVRIIDRGPHNPARLIDLSPAAAEALDMLRAGVANVELRPIDDGVVTRAE